jgi:protein SCO1/2
MMMNRNKHALFGMVVLVSLLWFGAGCGSTYEYRGGLMNPPAPLSDFELISSMTGQPVRLSDIEGDITLVAFGYTFCPDVCPMTLAQVKQALAGLEAAERERVQVIFISVDPERDTPEVLAHYMAAFDPAFIGLTGQVAQLEAVMKPFGAVAEKETVSDSAAGYLVSHTARLYLIDSRQQLLLQYGFDPAGSTVEDLRSDLTYLLK